MEEWLGDRDGGTGRDASGMSPRPLPFTPSAVEWDADSVPDESPWSAAAKAPPGPLDSDLRGVPPVSWPIWAGGMPLEVSESLTADNLHVGRIQPQGPLQGPPAGPALGGGPKAPDPYSLGREGGWEGGGEGGGEGRGEQEPQPREGCAPVSRPIWALSRSPRALRLITGILGGFNQRAPFRGLLPVPPRVAVRPALGCAARWATMLPRRRGARSAASGRLRPRGGVEPSQPKGCAGRSASPGAELRLAGEQVEHDVSGRALHDGHDGRGRSARGADTTRVSAQGLRREGAR